MSAKTSSKAKPASKAKSSKGGVKEDTEKRAKAFVKIFGETSEHFDAEPYQTRRFLDHLVMTLVTPMLNERIRKAETYFQKGAEYREIDYEVQFPPDKYALEAVKKPKKPKAKKGEKKSEEEKSDKPKATQSRRAVLIWHVSLRSSIGAIITGLINEFHLVAEKMRSSKDNKTFEDHLRELDEAAGEFLEYEENDLESYQFMQICRPFLEKHQTSWLRSANIVGQFTEKTTDLFEDQLFERMLETIALIFGELAEMCANKIICQGDKRRTIISKDVFEFFRSRIMHDEARCGIFTGVMMGKIEEFCKQFETPRPKKPKTEGAKKAKKAKKVVEEEDSKSDVELDDSGDESADSGDEDDPKKSDKLDTNESSEEETDVEAEGDAEESEEDEEDDDDASGEK
jgi:hypothetical protein